MARRASGFNNDTFREPLEMKKTLLILALGVTLGGCVTARAIRGPDGTMHQSITCPNTEMCYEKASEVCGGTYTIVNTNSQIEVGRYGGSSSVNMLVKCK